MDLSNREDPGLSREGIQQLEAGRGEGIQLLEAGRGEGVSIED